MRIVKIRSLLPAPAPGEPPGLTRFGTFLRRHNLDELPQLVQVLRGDLSLVGIRILPYPVYRGLAAAWSPERTRSWRCAYAHSALGLTGVHQVFRREGKEDELRFWRDRFYLRHASLGFDLYLIWRTIGRRQR